MIGLQSLLQAIEIKRSSHTRICTVGVPQQVKLMKRNILETTTDFGCYTRICG